MSDFDLTGALPFDHDANDQEQALTLGPSSFAYLGIPLTAEGFTEYVRTYNFGSVPPDFVVLHHTAIPSASWARYSSGAIWDDGEAGMGVLQIQNKRQRQLDALRDYYRDRLGWTAGPHLFIDERWIWLFTPMAEIGIHAAQGNSYRDAKGLHYSIGIEVIGYYEHVGWPKAVAGLVRHAVVTLQQRLKTFKLKYQPRAGGISAHRDYNKPQCPGAVITSSYYIAAITAPAAIIQPDWAAEWGPVATPDEQTWNWDIPKTWKANYQKLGKCIQEAAYAPNGVVIQLFQRGLIKAKGSRCVVEEYAL